MVQSNLEGTGMDIGNPSWWAVALGVGGAVFGFVFRSGMDKAKITQIEVTVADMRARLSALENGSVATATALATLTAQNESIGRTLARIEGRLDRAEGRDR